MVKIMYTAVLAGMAWSAENIEPWKLYEVYMLV
jgi:hypothetical protein